MVEDVGGLAKRYSGIKDSQDDRGPVPYVEENLVDAEVDGAVKGRFNFPVVFVLID
jgi:hypothetical protein